MSEHIKKSRPSRFMRLIATATAGVALIGCSTTESPPEPLPSYTQYVEPKPVPLERCFDTPLPAQKTYDNPVQLPRIHISRTPEGTIADDPGEPSELVKKKLDDATIKISNFLQTGTGVMIETSNGPILLTAAHVAYSALLKQDQDASMLEVVDHNGDKGEVVDICYMYETNGVFGELSSGIPQKTDLALVRLARPIGDDVLKLADSDEPRGSRNVWFHNFQSGRSVSNPASYGGIVLTDSLYKKGVRALTGVQSYRDCRPYENNGWESSCSIEPGASGGTYAQRSTAKLLGISVTAARSEFEYCADYESLAGYNVYAGFEVCPNSEAWTMIAGITSVGDIRAALSSPVYQS